jgi:hypothetical protein
MEPRIGGSYGQGFASAVQCTPEQPPSVYEERATEWFKAKERLGKATFEADRASAFLGEAREMEAAAWRALEEAAERGPQAPTGCAPKAIVGGYGPGRG